MNEEKIVKTLVIEISLPELFFFLSFKEHNVVKFIKIFNVFYSYSDRHNYAMFNRKELVFKYH